MLDEPRCLCNRVTQGGQYHLESVPNACRYVNESGEDCFDQLFVEILHTAGNVPVCVGIM